MPSKEQSFQRFLSKFVKIRVHNRVQSYIHPSKHSFKTLVRGFHSHFAIPWSRKKKRTGKKESLSPLEKAKILQIQFNFIDRASRKTSCQNGWNIHPPSIIRPVRHITRARMKRWGRSVGSRERRQATRLKKRLYGRKRRKNEEEGEEEASQIQLIEYRSNSSSSSSCFVFSPSFITETVDPPTWTNRAIRALYETAGYFARSRPLSRAPFPVWVERANKVSGAVLPWKRIGKEYRREEGW